MKLARLLSALPGGGDFADAAILMMKARFRFHGIEERLAAVEAIAGMELPVGDWEELEDEIIEGATAK